MQIVVNATNYCDNSLKERTLKQELFDQFVRNLQEISFSMACLFLPNLRCNFLPLASPPSLKLLSSFYLSNIFTKILCPAVDKCILSWTQLSSKTRFLKENFEGLNIEDRLVRILQTYGKKCNL